MVHIQNIYSTDEPVWEVGHVSLTPLIMWGSGLDPSAVPSAASEEVHEVFVGFAFLGGGGRLGRGRNGRRGRAGRGRGVKTVVVAAVVSSLDFGFAGGGDGGAGWYAVGVKSAKTRHCQDRGVGPADLEVAVVVGALPGKHPMDHCCGLAAGELEVRPEGPVAVALEDADLVSRGYLSRSRVIIGHIVESRSR